MSLQMIKDRVLIEEVKPELKSEGGIIYPASSDIRDDQLVKSESGWGFVKAKGKQVKSLQVGDKVYFGNFSGMPVEVEGEQFLMMNEGDIQAVVN